VQLDSERDNIGMIEGTKSREKSYKEKDLHMREKDKMEMRSYG